ncbi:MAG: DUF4177 domain-containing protein [Alphaproteobacteria bacterium]|jgi:hypothetical protein|nr:DUF4177 domain-containing protein [Alphaproteobacteria bacterium]MBU1279916.1 DUF4177 domain-containing protein [Alphaproteobacteria bacterium]MBU1575055.1 DUF4177 domain-containing protein [Alphaproteobacteria bacterium]MBU1827546.1 DUF4177 domain-containing protein [Alphaproteobacteria bacterium]MBU2078852.1 DUF4177 domain-containing protein [Alphaproteobacteria bacterium]
MPLYEYLTVPAPRKGEKTRGAKTPEARIALAMQSVLNDKGAEGWEYIRADLLPMEERSGLTSKAITYHTVLVFRRERGATVLATESTTEQAAVQTRKSPVADRNTPPPSVPFPAHAEKGAGANARRLSPDVADEIAEDRES